ncbi:MAG: conjugal transfer protein TraV [Rickettsiaceae bacterium]|nr:conjugal transfer protein TraV [Rickettsiaceae bacterium]
MMVFKKIILLVVMSMITSSCALWPYKKDFDCPIQEGLKCKSLYEVSKMADQGMFGPDAIKPKCKPLKNNKLRIKKEKNNNNNNDSLGYCTNG